MLRMPPLISLHSQFLWVWQLAAAGASTAGFLEKVAADLERELRTFKYPAMFEAEITQRVDARRKSEQRGGQAHQGFPQYTERQHRPTSLPGGRRWCYVRRGNDWEEGLKERRKGRATRLLSWPFTSFCTFLLNNYREILTAWSINEPKQGGVWVAFCRKSIRWFSNFLRKVGRLNTVIWGEHLKSLLATVYVWMHSECHTRRFHFLHNWFNHWFERPGNKNRK